MISLNNAAGIESFQWSSSEQVWPFEKDVDGSTLYCKELDVGFLPNSGTAIKAHGIANFNSNKVKRIVVRSYTTGASFSPLPYGHWLNSTYDLSISIQTTNIYIDTLAGLSPYKAIVEVIYKH